MIELNADGCIRALVTLLSCLPEDLGVFAFALQQRKCSATGNRATGQTKAGSKVGLQHYRTGNDYAVGRAVLIKTNADLVSHPSRCCKLGVSSQCSVVLLLGCSPGAGGVIWAAPPQTSCVTSGGHLGSQATREGVKTQSLPHRNVHRHSKA